MSDVSDGGFYFVDVAHGLLPSAFAAGLEEEDLRRGVAGQGLLHQAVGDEMVDVLLTDLDLPSVVLVQGHLADVLQALNGFNCHAKGDVLGDTES